MNVISTEKAPAQSDHTPRDLRLMELSTHLVRYR